MVVLLGGLLRVGWRRLACAREPVVALEGVRREHEVAHTWVIGEHHFDGDWLAAHPSSLVEHMRDRMSGERTASGRLAQGLVELGGAVPVEQAQQPAGGAAEVTAVQGNGREKRRGAGAGCKQAIAAAVLSRLALLSGELGQVPLVLDLPAAIPAALMPGDLRFAIEDAHAAVGRRERERLAHQRVGEAKAARSAVSHRVELNPWGDAIPGR